MIWPQKQWLSWGSKVWRGIKINGIRSALVKLRIPRATWQAPEDSELEALFKQVPGIKKMEQDSSHVSEVVHIYIYLYL